MKNCMNGRMKAHADKYLKAEAIIKWINQGMLT